MHTDDRLFLRDVHDVKYVFGDKWTIPIIVALESGPLRRSDIAALVNSFGIDENWPSKAGVLHDSILTRVLRKMLAEGLIAREETVGVFPPRVTYSLQPEAQDYLEMVRRVAGWSRRNPHIIERAREYYRSDASC